MSLATIAPSASAYEGEQSLKCNALGTINDWNATHTLELSPANPSVGDTVTVTASFDVGPTNGPVALTDGMVVPSAEVQLSGASSEVIELTGPGMGATPANGSMPGATLTGTFVASAGDTTATVNGFVFTAAAFGIVIPCNAGADPDASPAPTTISESISVVEETPYDVAITSIDGQNAGVTGYARAGDTINLDVTGFAANGTATASTCDLTGADCDAATASTTLDGDGAGSISLELGTPTVGARTLSVSDGTSTKLVPITILGQGQISITPSAGGVGTVVTITGSGFNPGQAVSYGTLVPDTSGAMPPVQPSSDTPAEGVADDQGNIGPVTFTVGDAATSYIGVIQGPNGFDLGTAVAFGYSGFTVSGDTCDATVTPCSLDYNLKQAVKGGSLSMARAEGTSTITFSDVTTSDAEQESSAALDTVTVKDLRGGTLGWSLVGTATDLTNASGASIPASALAWTPSCGDAAGSANVSGATAGSAGSFGGDALTLCNGDQNPTAGGPTGGVFEASADLSLTIPAFQGAGDYAGTLTLTLS